jgi:hypothetical protein
LAAARSASGAAAVGSAVAAPAAVPPTAASHNRPQGTAVRQRREELRQGEDGDRPAMGLSTASRQFGRIYIEAFCTPSFGAPLPQVAVPGPEGGFVIDCSSYNVHSGQPDIIS